MRLSLTRSYLPLVLLLLASCGGKQKIMLKTRIGDVSANMTDAQLRQFAPYQTFLGRVYPYLSENCQRCHGTSVTPTFALAAPENSYRTTKQVVGFPAYITAKLFTHGLNGHCGDDCSSDRRNLLAGHLEAWFQAEQKAAAESTQPVGNDPTPTQVPQSYSKVTRAQAVPTGSSQSPTVTFPLSDVDTSFTGAAVQLTFSTVAGGALRLSDARFLTGSAPLYVKKIIILINGGVVQGLNFLESVNRVIPAATNTLIRLETGSFTPSAGSNTVSLAFEDLRAPTSGQGAGKAQSEFTSNVRPILSASCFRCHQGSDATYGARARQHFDMSGDVYTQALVRLDDFNVQRSVFPLFEVLQASSHPSAATPLSTAQISTILTWASHEIPR